MFFCEVPEEVTQTLRSECAAIAERYVGMPITRRGILGMEVEFERAARRLIHDRQVFVMCEPDLANRSVPTLLAVPQWQHDCDECRFLGRAGDGGAVDLYVCHKGLRTFIARFSDDPSDYTSGEAFVGVVPELREAKRRHDRSWLDRLPP